MKLLLAMIALSLKTSMARRGVFFTRLAFALTNHGIVLAMWVFLFRAVPLVRGWNFWHLAMAYGLAWFAWGFVSFFAYGFKILPRIIEFGELDHFLLQPRSLLLMLAANSGDVTGIPDMLLALALIGVAAVKIKAAFVLIIMMIISSATVFTAFSLLVGSLAFWLNDMHDWLLELQFNLFVFATRPASAFGGWIKILMFSFLPMGFISYLPVEILRLNDGVLVAAQLAGNAAIIGVALAVFRLGLKRYESGNRFGVRV